MAKGKQQYHHGALRQALLDAALEILTEDGLDAMSLRAIARRAGVSQAAPYSHFKNRDEILAGVAQLGFERLSRDLRKLYCLPYDSWKNRLAVLRFVQDIPLKSGDRGYDIISETQHNLDTLKDVPTNI